MSKFGFKIPESIGKLKKERNGRKNMSSTVGRCVVWGGESSEVVRDRSQILQVNTRWKALAEIYTMHSFAPFSNLLFVVEIC